MVSIAGEAHPPHCSAMRSRFSTFVAFFWAVVFAILAWEVVASINDNSVIAVRVFDARMLLEGDVAALTCIGLAAGFTTSALLFVWCALLGVYDVGTEDGDQAFAMAHGAVAGFVTLCAALVLFLIWPSEGQGFSIIGALGLLAISCVAGAIEKNRAEAPEPAGATNDAPRSMALGAAHNSLLSRITGRAPREPGTKS